MSETTHDKPFLLLVTIEDDVEDVVRLAGWPQVSAFEKGFKMATNALGGPSWHIFVRHDGRWVLDDGCEEEQQEKLDAALAECKRLGFDVT